MIVASNYSDSTPITNSCWQEGYNLDVFVPPYQPPLQAAVFLLYFTLGFPLNVLIVVLVAKFKSLHQRDFAMAMQVVAADILFVLCLPFAIATMLGSNHRLVPKECYFMGFTKLFVNFVRFMMMFVLSLDRFCCVFFPFTYAAHGKKVCAGLSAAVWVLAMIVAAVPLAIDCYGYMPNFGFCMVQPYCSILCRSFTIGVVSAMVTFGGLVPTMLYSFMFLKARRLAKKELTAETAGSSRPHVTLLWLLVTLVGCSVPLTVVMVTFPPLYYMHPKVFWVFFGMGMTAFEAIVVADPIMIMRNRDLKLAAGSAAEVMKRFVLQRTQCCCKGRQEGSLNNQIL